MKKNKFYYNILVLGIVLFINMTYSQSFKPVSDPDGDWVLDTFLSDEFNGNDIKRTIYKDSVPSWSDGDWCVWHKGNSVVSEGNLNITMTHDPNDYYSNIVVGWDYDNEGLDDKGEHIQKLHKRSGKAALEFYDPDDYYRIKSAQNVTGLPNGTYTLKAWIWSSGNQVSAVMKAENNSGQYLSKNIEKSDGWEEYIINNIKVKNGTCKISFRVESYAGPQFVRIDDVTLIKDGTDKNFVYNGDFEILNKNPYKSGMIRSLYPISHGYIEARIKSSKINTASAFWLYRQGKDNWPEIDIVEAPQYSGTAQGARHKNYPLPKWPYQERLLYDDTSFDPSLDYHVYGLDWYKGGFKVYIDGKLKATYTGDYFDNYPMYLLMSMGRRGIMPENLPTTMKVDYLRVWKKATKNRALVGKATQSSTHKYYSESIARNAIDGIKDIPFSYHLVAITDINETEVEDWWEVDLGKTIAIDSIHVYKNNRKNALELNNYYVFVSDVPFEGYTIKSSQTQSGVSGFYQTAPSGNNQMAIDKIKISRVGRYVRIQLIDPKKTLQLLEVEVLGK